VTHFLNFALNRTLGIGEARHFKFCILIDTQEYYCMRNILHRKGMCLESSDLFKFWEINDNISLKVQDREA